MAWGGRGSASPLPNDEAVSSRAGFVCALLPVHRGPAGRWQQSSASAERAKATGDIPCCMSQPCVTAPSPQRGAASPPCTAGSRQAAPGEHGGELGLYGLKDPPLPSALLQHSQLKTRSFTALLISVFATKTSSKRSPPGGTPVPCPPRLGAAWGHSHAGEWHPGHCSAAPPPPQPAQLHKFSFAP